AKVFFSPRNKTDMLFQGTFWITLDSSYVIKKIDMSVNTNINLNWVKDLKIVQEFDKMEDGNWILSSDEISVDFGLSKNKMGIFGQRAVYYKDYKINKIRGDSTYTGLKLVVDKNAEKHDAIFWEKNRFQQLSKSEKGTYDVIDSVKKVPAFRRTMDILMILLEGYKDVGYFDVGPVSTFYSYNPIEGLRLRFGGRTTNKFSKKYNIESYLAYGFKDENFKYYLGGTYSLTERNVFEFPVKSIKVSYQDETKIPGQELQFVQEDNFLLSIKRGVNDKLLYNKTFKIEHLNEFNNHFSYTLGFENIIQRPSGSLFYNTMDYSLHNNNPDKVNISELYVNLRYAPNEQFYQGKSYRIPIELKYPVFQLQYSLGSKYLQNDYNYNKLILRIDKRFNMSVIGYSDVSIEYGKIFGTVSYPELFIARANQTYSYQLQSYNLMNFLEFVSDEYASLNYEHCFNGFIFNKIPIVKKLKLREIISCKALYGKVSDRNNPENNKDLFKFPVDNNSVPITYTLDKQPYIEASVGIANIFKLFRIDLVRRLTYTDHPNVSSTGIRARFKLDF
ncbi:MAG: DUF5686 family protein, partial [Bacteroidota bacterium]|nr:DUF5686 family protein [Bacteroidota bacterium]